MKRSFLQEKFIFSGNGFTIIELIVVIAIIAVLSGIVISNVSRVKEKANVSGAGAVQRQMTKAIEMYYMDMNFYPPDVNRGWDPGLVQKYPWNPDGRASGSYSTSGEDWTHCPDGTRNSCQVIIEENWHGPYLSSWPVLTPWGGTYDYNYWAVEVQRGNCPLSLAPGIYIGAEKYYNDISGSIPESIELEMQRYGFEVDCITNGEAQMLLKLLP